MRLQRFLSLLLMVGLSGLLMGSSCLNPCEQLAEKICTCKDTEGERQACKRQAKIQQEQRELDNPARVACQEKLSTCECRALDEGDLAACGLSKE